METLSIIRDLAVIFLGIVVLVWTLVQAALYFGLYWGLRRFGGRGVTLVHRGRTLTERAASSTEQGLGRVVVRPVARSRGRAEWLRTFYRGLR